MLARNPDVGPRAGGTCSVTFERIVLPPPDLQMKPQVSGVFWPFLRPLADGLAD